MENQARIAAQTAGRLGGFLERAREEIAASAVAGFDETGFRVEGKLHLRVPRIASRALTSRVACPALRPR